MKMDRTADHDHGGRGFNAILNTHPSLVQGSPEGCTPGLMIFVPAIARKDLTAKFSQPGPTLLV